MKVTLRLLVLALVLLIGFLIGYLPFRHSLQRCQQDREALTSDLTRAVGRGVLIEAQLNVCKGGQKDVH